MTSKFDIAGLAVLRAGPARDTGGFTLVEVLLVITILGVLAAITVPGYQEYVQRGYRAEARTALMRAATMLERRYTVEATYPTAADFPTLYNLPASTTIYSSPDAPGSIDRSKYRITYQQLNGGVQYTLTATLINGTDAKCGVYTLNDRMVKTVSGTSTVEQCWR